MKVLAGAVAMAAAPVLLALTPVLAVAARGCPEATDAVSSAGSSCQSSIPMPGPRTDIALPARPPPYTGGPTGCVVPDPTGTGGCVTAATAHLLAATHLAFDGWRWGVSCWDEHAWSPGSDHPLGRACDFTVGGAGRMPSTAEADVGWALAEWYRVHADGLQVSYVIWSGRIWSADRTDQGWRAYDGGGVYDPAEPTGGHYDHVHVSLSALSALPPLSKVPGLARQ